MKNYSQTFVKYHGCGNCYIDGTNMLIETGRKCIAATNNPFWKRPIDSNSKIAKSTRNELKIKSRAETEVICKNMQNLVKIAIKMNIMSPTLVTIMNLQTLILKFQTLQVTNQQLVMQQKLNKL